MFSSRMSWRHIDVYIYIAWYLQLQFFPGSHLVGPSRQVVPTISKTSSLGAKSTSKNAAYQAIRRLVKKNSSGIRRVSDAIAKQFKRGGKGQADLIQSYIAAGGDIET